MEYKLIQTKIFEDDAEKHLATGNIKNLKKIASFLEEIKGNPITGTGKPEQLKGFKNRVIYSRRIDQKHRFIYEIFEEEKYIEILSCYGHYDDK